MIDYVEMARKRAADKQAKEQATKDMAARREQRMVEGKKELHDAIVRGLAQWVGKFDLRLEKPKKHTLILATPEQKVVEVITGKWKHWTCDMGGGDEDNDGASCTLTLYFRDHDHKTGMRRFPAPASETRDCYGIIVADAVNYCLSAVAEHISDEYM